MDTSFFDALAEEDLLLNAAVLHRQKKPTTNQNKMGARNLEISPASTGAENYFRATTYLLTTYIFEE